MRPDWVPSRVGLRAPAEVARWPLRFASTSSGRLEDKAQMAPRGRLEGSASQKRLLTGAAQPPQAPHDRSPEARGLLTLCPLPGESLTSSSRHYALLPLQFGGGPSLVPC